MKEWRELETKARELLDDPYLLPKDAILKLYRPILRLWIYPSFSSSKVWIFYEPDFRMIKVANLVVREVTWDRIFDSERLLNPLQGLKHGFDANPRLEIKLLEIKKEFFDQIFHELKEISFPAFTDYRRSVGLDGEGYGIETFDFTHRTKISWWSMYPDEWQPLIKWFEKITDNLRGEFSKIE